MLVVAPDGALEDGASAICRDFIRPGDALVVNDTRVIAARLDGIRVRGDAVAAIEATLIKRLDASRWRALVRPAKKLKVGERIRFGETQRKLGLPARRARRRSRGEGRGRRGDARLRLLRRRARRGDRALGAMPLPPYIAARRASRRRDRADYQTMFAREHGAVAAPTAGLHFTPALLARIEAAGASLHRVTLHVGAGTFLPVKADDTRDHAMHAEWGRLDAATAEALNADARARRAHRRGRHHVGAPARKRGRREMASFAPFEGETAIFITPGYRFRAVDVLLTNFHLPRSTLFMLVSAFSGLETMQRRLCACDRRRLSLLFLWRRLPAARFCERAPSVRGARLRRALRLRSRRA